MHTDMNGLEQWDRLSPPRCNRGLYVPTTGRGRSLGLLYPPHPRAPASSISFPHPRSALEADTQPGIGRDLQTSLPRRSRGLLAFATGRGKDSEGSLLLESITPLSSESGYKADSESEVLYQ